MIQIKCGVCREFSKPKKSKTKKVFKTKLKIFLGYFYNRTPDVLLKLDNTSGDRARNLSLKFI